jgi:glycosyltransferase involved in cell wall biosynthesis
MARHTDTLVTINKEDYERAKRTFKTDVQYTSGVGIDPKRFAIKVTKQQKTKLRQSLGLKDTDFVMIYLAELSKRKNQLWLIRTLAETIKKNPSMHLLLAGQDSLNGKCQELVVELGLENVHFLGYRKDIPALLKTSDLAVSSSLQEGLPVNIMEAMCAGLPIVAVDCRGSRDLIQQKVNGFIIEPDDSKAFVRRVKLLARNTDTRKEVSSNNKKKVKAYELDDILESFKTIYSRPKVVIHLLNSSKFSGAENVACEIIKSTKSNFESFYCSPAGSIDKALQSREIKQIKLNKLSYKSLFNVIKEYKPTVIHAHDFRASIIASLFSKNVKVISHIHQNPAWLEGLNMNAFLYRVTLKNYSKVIVVTDSIRKTRTFANMSTERVVTFYNTVDKKDILQKAKEKVARHYDLGFCGRLEPVKQPQDFIRLVAEIKKKQNSVTAVMIGDGSLADECRKLIETLNLQNNIELTGFQENPFKYMNRCRFFVVTSQAEGFGLAAIEAMILGAIVISYKIDSIQEIMNDNKNVFGENIEELTDIYLRYSKSDKLKEIIDYNKKLTASLSEAPQLKQKRLLRLYEEV